MALFSQSLVKTVCFGQMGLFWQRLLKSVCFVLDGFILVKAAQNCVFWLK